MPKCRCHPTRIFALLMVLWLVMLLQAYMHNYNIVYLMLFFTIGISVAVFVTARRNLKGLSVSFLSQERIFANTPGDVTFMIANNGDRSRYDIALNAPARCALVRLEGYAQKICKGGTGKLSRGVFIPEELELESYFPLTLFHCRLALPCSGIRIRVFPRPYGMPLRRYISAEPSRHGEREDFDGLRRYERGDAMAAIHWKASARSGVLYTKRFTHSSLRPALNFDYDALPGDKEARLSQLCLWVLACEKEGRICRIKLGTHRFDTAHHSTDEVLDAMARF